MNDPQTSTNHRILLVLQNYRGLVLFLLVMFVFRSAVADWNQVPTGSMVPSILVGDRILVNKMAYSLRIPFTLQPLAEFAPPQRGDVVTFESPTTAQLLVKRVIGVPGDRVAMQHNVLRINGHAASYAPSSTTSSTNSSTTSSTNNATSHQDASTVTVGSNSFAVTLWQETFGAEIDAEIGAELDAESGAETHQIALANERPAYARRSFAPITVPPNYFLMLGDNRDFSEDSRVIGFIHRRQIVGRAYAIAFSFDLDALRPRGDRFFKALE